jgi:hypothetical protein
VASKAEIAQYLRYRIWAFFDEQAWEGGGILGGFNNTFHGC